jgi:hypothetical protein
LQDGVLTGSLPASPDLWSGSFTSPLSKRGVEGSSEIRLLSKGKTLFKTAMIGLLLAGFAFSALAEANQMQSEIDHLLSYIEKSGCKFIRNGKGHAPEEAVRHILKKYEYFKNRIHDTESFIDFCASKSLLTNRPYEIGCPGQDPVESKNWLLVELRKFRSQHPAAQVLPQAN